MSMHIRKGGKFMKLKKKSGLMGAVIALSAASLVSVGFASWVISQGDSVTPDGTILVDNVENHIHTIDESNSGWLDDLDGDLDPTKNKIVYGASEAALASDGWLKNDGVLGGGDSTESSAMVLKAWYQIKVNNVSASEKLSDVVDSELTTLAVSDLTKYNAAKTNYVGDLPTPKAYIGGSAATADTLVGTAGLIVFELEFKWNATYGTDPYAYWISDAALTANGGDETARRQAAYDWFNGLGTALQGLTYTLTITTK